MGNGTETLDAGTVHRRKTHDRSTVADWGEGAGENVHGE